MGNLVSSTPHRPGPRFWNSSGHAVVMLVLVTVFWGLSFPLMKNWQNATAHGPGNEWFRSSLLIAVRMFLALALFAAFRPRFLFGVTGREFGIGCLIGLSNFAGFLPQVLGLASTSPALSSFFTSLSSVWVPMLAWACFGIAIQRPTIIGLFLGISGATVLGLNNGDGNWRLSEGDLLTVLSSLLFAVEILLIDRLGRKVAPGHLTAGFLVGTGLPAMGVAAVTAGTGPGFEAAYRWCLTLTQDAGLMRDVALLTVFSTVLSSHWLVVYQPRVPAGRAALIYLLEPVFGSLFSIAVGHDELTRWLCLGGLLILTGNLLVELPALLRAARGPVPARPAEAASRDRVLPQENG